MFFFSISLPLDVCRSVPCSSARSMPFHLILSCQSIFFCLYNSCCLLTLVLRRNVSLCRACLISFWCSSFLFVPLPLPVFCPRLCPLTIICVHANCFPFLYLSYVFCLDSCFRRNVSASKLLPLLSFRLLFASASTPSCDFLLFCFGLASLAILSSFDVMLHSRTLFLFYDRCFAVCRQLPDFIAFLCS